MADSFTSKLNLTKPEVGSSTDTWGTKLNADLDSIDGLFDTGPYLKIAKGGTGAGTAANARTNLGLGTMAVQDASSVTITGGSVTGITDITVADGGTGSSTAAGARTNLDAQQVGVMAGVNAQTSDYTLVLTDRGKVIDISVSAANNVTIPTNSSVAFPTGSVISVISTGVGQTTFVPSGGVTLLSYGTKRKLTGQYSMATLIKKDTDTWYLAGDLIG